jgi:hypothetical protein
MCLCVFVDISFCVCVILLLLYVLKIFRELHNIQVKPGLRHWDSDFLPWVCDLQVIVDKALNRGNNIAGFKRAGIQPVNREVVTSSLPQKCPTIFASPPPKTSLFQINNHLVTDKTFLVEWKEDETKKQDEKKKKQLDSEKKKEIATERKKEKYEKMVGHTMEMLNESFDSSASDSNDSDDDNGMCYV